MNEQQTAVAALLAAKNISYNVTSLGPRTKRDSGEPWECDAWLCRFARAGKQEEFEYFTGTGHRKQVKPMVSPPYKKNTLAYEEWAKDAFRAVAPCAADVLYSLILDSSATSQSFESWAKELGYDTDSRKAEATYRACQQYADKLVRIFDHATRTELAALLEDY